MPQPLYAEGSIPVQRKAPLVTLTPKVGWRDLLSAYLDQLSGGGAGTATNAAAGPPTAGAGIGQAVGMAAKMAPEIGRQVTGAATQSTLLNNILNSGAGQALMRDFSRSAPGMILDRFNYLPIKRTPAEIQRSYQRGY